MSWPDATDASGYTKDPNKDKSGNDLGAIRTNPSVQDCMAACNASSRCKSIAYKKDGSVCYLKTYTQADNAGNSNNYDMYYKTSDQNNLGVRYRTKAGVVNGNSGGGWDNIWTRNDGGVCDSDFDNGRATCDYGMFELGGSALDCAGKRNRTCGFAPKATRLCPNIAESPEDVRFIKHDIVGDDLDYGAAPWGFGGRDPSQYKPSGITCGYSRIKRSEWENLDRYFDVETKKNIIWDHCTGPGVTSKELVSDTSCVSYLTRMGMLSRYNAEIIKKLRSEQNWWNDATNCTNMSTVITGNTSDNLVMQEAVLLINSLPTSGWSDDLVKALNAIKMHPNVPRDSVKVAIDTKIDSYCSSSNGGDMKPVCACRNAAKYGKDRTCTATGIVGCADVARMQALINRAKSTNQQFGDQLQMIYDPNSQSEACVNAKGASSTILAYGDITTQRVDVAACFTAYENSGTIGGDVTNTCNIAIQNQQSGTGSATGSARTNTTSTTTSGGGTSSSSSSTGFGSLFSSDSSSEGSTGLGVSFSMFMVSVIMMLALAIVGVLFI